MLSSLFTTALLALADGTIFSGWSFGAEGCIVGEIIFNTSLTGYQEILTDPSYAQQIITLTCPHIGNVGINSEDIEASHIYASGLVIRDLPVLSSNFRQTCTLAEFLKSQNTIGIFGIDTRRLTRILRDNGTQNACIITTGKGNEKIDVNYAIKLARNFVGISGIDLVKDVSSIKPYEWTQTTWSLKNGYNECKFFNYKIVVLDYGVKYNILRMLAERGCKVIVLPAYSTITQALQHEPDGVLLSNGPGDPEPCEYAISIAREFIARSIPTFGICLGHQIVALALGAKTIKMRNGHHGANHPVRDLDSGRVFITSQNHSFTIDKKTLPFNVRITHTSLFDQTIQGFQLTDKPILCFQGHPEASPGPIDASYLFDRFINLIHTWNTNNLKN